MADIIRENNKNVHKIEISNDGAKFYVYQLKHAQSLDLNKIWLDLEDVSNLRNITIPYETPRKPILFLASFMWYSKRTIETFSIKSHEMQVDKAKLAITPC